MRVGGRHYRSIWIDEGEDLPAIIDQTELPHRFVTRRLRTVSEVVEAIRTMRVRGAPLIGATAAYGLWLAMREDASDEHLARSAEMLTETRPTAVNLRWAVDRVVGAIADSSPERRESQARAEAIRIADEDVRACERIGDHGAQLLLEVASAKQNGRPLEILTHCNAGWLATVDWGTALAPIYKIHDAGHPVHVWVDETRPRNQGSSLTAFELREHGVPHTVVVDNAGGQLMQEGRVDAVVVGSDRTTSLGDVCNKVGTYLKALAADANQVPFFVALPVSTIDWTIRDGLREIPIEYRSDREVREVVGLDDEGVIRRVSLFPESSPVANPGFDVTPARYVSRLITELGTFEATPDGLGALGARIDAQVGGGSRPK